MMSLPGWTPLALGTALYLWQAINYYHAGQFPMCSVFLGYCVANCGLIWDWVVRIQPKL